MVVFRHYSLKRNFRRKSFETNMYLKMSADSYLPYDLSMSHHHLTLEIDRKYKNFSVIKPCNSKVIEAHCVLICKVYL